MADMNNTIDINQAENEILLSLNGTLIPEYHDGNEHEFDPGKTHAFETEINPDNIFFRDDLSSCKYYSHLCASINSKNGINIIHFNARSMDTNFKQIESYIHTFEIEFDIIAISETWNDPTTLRYYELPKYNSFQVCREDARGGGVALYVHKDIQCSKCISKSLTVNGIFECVTIELAIPNKKNIIVSCIYRKPGSNIDTFCENVERIFENNPHNKTIFLCGDFNIDILKQDRHLSTK